MALYIFQMLGAVLLVVILKDSLQGFIYPMALVVFAFRKPLSEMVGELPVWLAFLGTGTILGLITEAFAILENRAVAFEDRALLHPYPGYDLLFAFFYYALFMLTWYLLLRKIAFPKTAVFIGAGLYGGLAEQGGAYMLNVVANPLYGTIMLFIIMTVYAIFPTLTYMLTQPHFTGRVPARWWHYLLLPIAMFLFWAIYGNFVHPWLLDMFPTGF